MNQNRVMKNLLSLCQIGSISASETEKEMPALLKELLLEIPYFQQNPNQIKEYHVHDNEKMCGYIMALMRATKPIKKTIVLLSHFDVVGIDEYGIGAPYAFDPIAYTEFLKKGKMILDEESQKDLDSGNYLFGRGVCDMKWGIASDLELLHEFSNQERDANLLFVSVPDEERNSLGMLDAVKKLVLLANQEDLDYSYCIVGEPDISPDKCEKGRRIFIGAAGKLMPFFYFVGKETHVGDPYYGLNPNLLSSKLVEKMENNPNLIDYANGYYTPAPSCLKHSDCKNHYSVQTPYDAYAYFNLMTLTKTPNQILKQMHSLALEVFEEVLGLRSKHIEEASLLLKQKLPYADIKPQVMTYQALYQSCLDYHGTTFQQHMEQYIKSLEEDDMRKMTLSIIQETQRYAPNRDPKIILAFAPPFYPHSGFLKEDDSLRHICKLLIEDGKQYQEQYVINECFNGLTDMCYLGLRMNVDLEELKANFPLWGEYYEVPLKEMNSLNIPFINFGPHGKDPHCFTERIELTYSMNHALVLLKQLTHHLMHT